MINVIDTRHEDADLRGGVGWSSITPGGAQSEGACLGAPPDGVLGGAGQHRDRAEPARIDRTAGGSQRGDQQPP
jgi:hypothetical protein